MKLCKNNKHNLKYWIYAIDIELTKLGREERGLEVNEHVMSVVLGDRHFPTL